MHAQYKAVVPMSRLGGSVAQARTAERAVPQHIVDSFTVGGRSLGRKLSTCKLNSPSLQTGPTQTRTRNNNKPQWMVYGAAAWPAALVPRIATQHA